MSVAFRRDSDEEHREPRPELPVPPGPNLVTRRGLALIEAKVGELEAALAAGGSEEELAGIKRDLRYWHLRRATAQLAPIPDGEEAAFGTRVGYRIDGGPLAHADIVGADEADPATGRIAFNAPLARAMIGTAPGERVDLGARRAVVEILSVEPIEDAA